MPDNVIQSNRYKIFSVGAIGTFMSTLDGSILNVALPTISRDFDIPVDVVAWVVLAYSLTLISLMLVFGLWAGIRGYFFSYRFGYVLFIFGSALCSFSLNIYMLILARVIQATGTAMFAAIGPGMVTQVFPREERGKGIGMMVMMVSAGFMVGPPLGGFLLGVWHWPAIFIINIPVGLVGLYMTNRYLKDLPLPKATRKLHFHGAVGISLALLAATFALSLINDYAISDIRIWGLGLLALAGIGAFFKFEASNETAIIGLDVFRNRTFVTSIGAMLFMFIASSGIFILLPFYLEQIKHFEPQQVGLFLIILPVIMFIVAPISGWLSDRIGYRILTATGVITVLAGLYLIRGLDLTTTSYYIIMALAVVGIGTGIFSTPNSSALMGSVREDQRAVTSSILATTRNIGMSVGVALSTALFSFFQSGYAYLADDNLIFVKSYHNVIGVSAAAAFVSLVFSLTRHNKLT